MRAIRLIPFTIICFSDAFRIQQPIAALCSRSVLHAEPQQQQRKKKKNKYAQFSKQETLDPMDAMLLESRTKLKEISKSKQLSKKADAVVLGESLEAVEELLSSIAPEEEEEEKRMWERNKRQFPDNKSIDPYDPTTYGYIELGKFPLMLARWNM